MEEFPPNPRTKPSTKKTVAKKTAPKENKRLEKVIEGGAKERPKTVGERFRAIFIRADLGDVAKYITTDVIIPAVRDMLYDTATESFRRTLYGEDRDTRKRRGGRGRGPHVSYNEMSDPRRRRRESVMLPDQPPRHAPPTGAEKRMLLSSREDAERILDRMEESVDEYGAVSVANLFELAGMPVSAIDYSWGWTELAYTEIRQVREGWLIDFPPTTPL